MVSVKAALLGLRSHLESIAGYPVYTGQFMEEGNAKEALVLADEGDPWSLGLKTKAFGVVIYFRYRLNMIEPVTPNLVFYEDDVIDEVGTLLQRIMFKTIPPGLTLVDERTGFGHNEETHCYECITRMRATIGR